MFRAESGRSHFNLNSERLEVLSLLETCDKLCLQDAIIAWMKGAFERVGAKDEDCGEDAMFVISTRESPEFSLV